MKIITGYRGEAHITSKDDQSRNQGIFGTGAYLLEGEYIMTPTKYSNTQIRISKGAGVLKGVHFRVEENYDVVSFTPGTAGMERYDVVVAQYTRDPETDIESIKWAVVEGTPAASGATIPAVDTSGSIMDGSEVVNGVFFTVKFNGTNLSGTITVNAPKLNAQVGAASVWQSIDSGASRDDILDAIDALYANTGRSRISGFLAGAQAVLLGIPNESYIFDLYANSTNLALLVARDPDGDAVYQLSKRGGMWASNWYKYTGTLVN